jgi:hypothetical protein
VHTKQSIQDTENRFTLLERTTHQVQDISMWAPLVAHRMSKQFSISCQMFSFIWGVTEATTFIFMHEIQPHCKLLDVIPFPLHSPIRKSAVELYQGSEGGRGIGPSHSIHLFGGVLYRDSHCKAPVWRGTILLKENVCLKVCHLQDCTEKLHEPPKLYQLLLKPCLCPSYAGHCLSLETVPTITWGTVFSGACSQYYKQ